MPTRPMTQSPKQPAQNGDWDPADTARFLTVPDARPGAVALLSGGLDSAIMVAAALQGGDSIHPLYVHQGFLWEDAERKAVERFLASLSGNSAGRLHPLVSSTLEAPSGFSTRWAVDSDQAPPHALMPDESVYLPGRNLALLTQAAMLAYTAGVTRIQLGILDCNPFPDGTASFFRAFEAAAGEAMNWEVRVETPLRHLTKTEVLERGIRFELGLTLSCIRPREGLHCGLCAKCAEREKAFRQAGLVDPSPHAGR